ncbi:MAG: hypothetical protein K6G66_09610 [Oscillospiraceae bacterium]|nr:hypothetical protein [Oscillospiraceae bacterium]
MKNRRIVYFLSALLLVVLMCGLTPSASAENAVTCMCPCCTGMCRGGAAGDSLAVRPASPAADTMKPVRVETLTNFLTTALAAEEETDPAVREQLLAESNLLWNDYIDLVLMPFMPAAEPDEDVLKPARVETLTNFLTTAVAAEEATDPAIREQLLAESNLLWNDYMDLVLMPFMPAAEPATEPAAAEPDEDVLKPVRVETLTNFLTTALAAEEATDPAVRDELLTEASLLWNNYFDLVIEPFKSGELPQTDSDIYLDSRQDPYCGAEDPYCKAEDPYADQYQQYEAGSTAQQPLMIGLPNPWTETESLEEAIRISGIAFDPPVAEALPEGMELFFYRAMPGTIEADYSNGKDELTIRVSMDENGYYLAGDYNTYSHEWQENVKGLTVDCLGDGKNANVAVFSTGDLAFSLGSACGREGAGISEDTLKSLIMGMQAVPAACEQNGEDISVSAEPDVYADPQPQNTPLMMQEKPEPEKNGETMILFTGGVHAAIDNGFGYAGLKALRDSLEEQGYATVLVDNGDALRGDDVGEASKGRAVIDLMNAVGYDLAVPGCDEFSFGIDQLTELGKIADFPYVCCNFTMDGEPALPLCAMVELDNGTNIAFVGVTAPSAIAGDAQQSAEDLWNTVQDAVDIARAAGADLVYGMGHLGEDENCRPWTASDLIANTAGIDIFIDGHGDDNEQLFVMNKEGKPVILSGCGSWFNCIGYSRISADGEIMETGLWAWPNALPARAFFGFDNDVSEMAEAIRQKTVDELNAAAVVPDAAHTEQESAVSTEKAPAEAEFDAPAYLVF